MKNKGFTLIELLVVVLIIGILAAIAVPQYQKSVLKSRFVQGYTLVDSLYEAEHAYFLANGDFAQDIDNLDVSIPKDSSCTKSQGTSSIYVCDFGRISLSENKRLVDYIYIDGNNKMIISYMRPLKNFNLSSYNLNFKAGERYCFASSSNNTKMAKEVCEGLGGTAVPNANNMYWYYYRLP